uniref:SFRICE_031522 n=1 Tax=Spodoptera frugiperda TaxID=7108 RepID=A0A2H1WT32_SPOFR
MAFLFGPYSIRLTRRTIKTPSNCVRHFTNTTKHATVT